MKTYGGVSGRTSIILTGSNVVQIGLDMNLTEGLVLTEVLKVNWAGGDKPLTGTSSSMRKQDINTEDTSQLAGETLPFLKCKQRYSGHEI